MTNAAGGVASHALAGKRNRLACRPRRRIAESDTWTSALPDLRRALSDDLKRPSLAVNRMTAAPERSR